MGRKLVHCLLLVGTFACQVYDEELLSSGDSGPAAVTPDTGASLDARADGRAGESAGGGGSSVGGAAGTTGAGGATGGAAGAGGATGATAGAGGARGGAAGSAGAGGATDGAAGAGGATGATAGAGGAQGGAAGSAGAGGAGAGAAGATGGMGGVAGTFGCNMDAGACRDGAADAEGGVIDRCPTDPGKTDPGVCGCGAPDPPNPDAGEAFCLRALLVHRYSFDGTGTAAVDSIGAANGAIMGGANAVLSGGTLSVTGDIGAGYTSEGFVSLPSGILGGLSSATFETWVTWRGTGSQGSQAWQRIFEFGDQVASGANLVGYTYLFLTPATNGGLPRVAYSINGNANETMAGAASSFPLAVEQHVAVVIDDPNDTMTLYFNGNQAGAVQLVGLLAAINNVNSWLGRSGYSVDPEFNGVFDEFRIYKAALTANQIRASYAAGPNPPFF